MEGVSPLMMSSSFIEVWNMTSAAAGGGKRPLPFIFQFIKVAMLLLRVLPPVILCVGTLGNVMTVVIMRRLTSEDSTINIYFTAIAGVDLLYLWTIVLDQTLKYNAGVDIKAVHGVFCKVFTWLYTGGGTVSCWYLVCMTVHRAMSVVWPHRVNSLCTRRTVVITLSTVTVVIALLYSHSLVGLDVVVQTDGSYKCTLTTPSYVYFHSNIFVFIELLAYSALPFVMLVFANSALIWKLAASTRTTQGNLTEGSSGLVNTHTKLTNSVTKTVIAVSVTFLILTLPSSVDFILTNLVHSGHQQTSLVEAVRVYSVTIICSLLSHTNHAVNFYLYCLTGRRFREEFLKLLCCGRAGPRLVQGMPRKEAASG